MTVEEKANLIIRDVKKIGGCNPVRIFKEIADNDYISMHGPEHHVLDGACILTAFYNAGGNIDLEKSLEKLLYEGLRMPGAMCGLWGICGAITSIGAALAIIDGTGPLSEDGTWGEHMAFTAAAIGELGQINGPRCCKRDAMIAFRNAVEYINSHYDVRLEYEDPVCTYSERNQQCIQENCPFYPKIRLAPMTDEMYHCYFKEYENDPDLFLKGQPYISYTFSEEKVDQYIQRQKERKRIPLAILWGDEIVGEIILKNIEEHKCATMGMVLKNAKYKDRGIGTAAEKLAIRFVFWDLDIPTLYADTIQTNTRSQHVLEKVGFTLIGEDKDYKYYRIERGAVK